MSTDPNPLRDALDSNSVVVSDDLLLRLNVHTGDSLRIGGQDFRIAGVVTAEPVELEDLAALNQFRCPQDHLGLHHVAGAPLVTRAPF